MLTTRLIIRQQAVLAALAIAVMATAGGCVTTGTFNAKMAEKNAELDKLRGEHRKQGDDLATAVKERDELRAKYAEAETKIADLEGRLTAVTAERDKLRKSLDDTTALAGQLKERL